jgi:16S rRNA (guanine966-N2)-methyltransferase
VPLPWDAPVRVIAGAFKGRRLATPGWTGLRPTSDKLRETLFNVLGGRIEGARVLDGFAGTGAVGIEALSRGAAAVTFVERDARAVALVRENLARCGVADRCAIIRADLRQAARGRLSDARFDVIVLDPPYDGRDVPGALDAAAALVAPGGVLVLEHARRRPAPDTAGALARARDLAAGDSALAFYLEQPA